MLLSNRFIFIVLLLIFSASAITPQPIQPTKTQTQQYSKPPTWLTVFCVIFALISLYCKSLLIYGAAYQTDQMFDLQTQKLSLILYWSSAVCILVDVVIIGVLVLNVFSDDYQWLLVATWFLVLFIVKILIHVAFFIQFIFEYCFKKQEQQKNCSDSIFFCLAFTFLSLILTVDIGFIVTVYSKA